MASSSSSEEEEEDNYENADPNYQSVMTTGGQQGHNFNLRRSMPAVG